MIEEDINRVLRLLLDRFLSISTRSEPRPKKCGGYIVVGEKGEINVDSKKTRQARGPDTELITCGVIKLRPR